VGLSKEPDRRTGKETPGGDGVKTLKEKSELTTRWFGLQRKRGKGNDSSRFKGEETAKVGSLKEKLIEPNRLVINGKKEEQHRKEEVSRRNGWEGGVRNLVKKNVPFSLLPKKGRTYWGRGENHHIEGKKKIRGEKLRNTRNLWSLNSTRREGP